MKFTSIQSLSPDLRTNAVFCLLFLVFFSLQSLISSVRLIPNDRTVTMWSTSTPYVTCKADHGHNGGSLKWYQVPSPNNQPITQEHSKGTAIHTQDSGDSNKLMIMKASKKNSGIYECRHIKGDKVISSDRFELKVFNAIDMSMPENREQYIGTEGDLFSMPCFVKFDPDSTDTTVTWRFNNHNIKREGDPQFSVENDASVKTDQGEYKKFRSTLTIKNLNKEHEGNYVCQAESGNEYLTSIQEKVIGLRVLFKPKFLDKNHKNVWISDESVSEVLVNVTCIVNADPKATFTWYTDDGLVIPNTTHSGHHGRGSKMPEHSIIGTENVSVLSLKYTSLDQLRKPFNDPNGKRNKFKCVANNTIGNAKQDFSINIGKLPEPPILDHTSYDNGVLTLTVNQTEVTPPIDEYRVEIDKNIQVFFNESHRVDPQNKANNTYRIEVGVSSGHHKLTLHAHNPVGWSSTNNPELPMSLVISGSTLVQQYLVSILLASALALLYAL